MLDGWPLSRSYQYFTILYSVLLHLKKYSPVSSHDISIACLPRRIFIPPTDCPILLNILTSASTSAIIAISSCAGFGNSTISFSFCFISATGLIQGVQYFRYGVASGCIIVYICAYPRQYQSLTNRLHSTCR